MMHPFTLCARWPVLMELKDLSIDPEPPRINKDITEIWHFRLDAVITQGAKFHEVWTLGSMTVLDRDVDVCSVLSRSGLECPIRMGDHTARYTYSVTGDDLQIPPFVTIGVHREFFNNDGSRLLCYDTAFKFMP